MAGEGQADTVSDGFWRPQRQAHPCGHRVASRPM